MNVKQAPTFRWQRFWIPHCQTPTLADGYFVEPASGDFARLLPPSNGRALSELADLPCVILLGRMGMGKTTTIRQEVDELRKRIKGQNHIVVLKDLKCLTETQMRRDVFEDPGFVGWVQGRHTLTLFLDSMDECWRRLDELESILVGELDRHIRTANCPLFLRLTCRSGEWRTNVADALKRLFQREGGKQDQVAVYSLAPLTESNVRDAAKVSGIDPEAFLKRIAERMVQALAYHPITLKMLLHIYKTGGELPDSRAQLYEQGCLHFCADLHSVPGSKSNKTTTAEQRLAIAGRLAAVSVLTNRHVINIDANQPSIEEGVLQADKIFGYYEETFGGQKLEVTQGTALEAVQTALFALHGDGLLTWAHQSYAEFLAAKYLAGLGLSNDQLASLVLDTNDNAKRLIPQLEETASWLVEAVHGLFNLLAPTNAETFIRNYPVRLENGQREVLVGGYLDLIRRHEAPELDWPLKDQLARLDHPHLGKQLGSVILDRRADPLVRESALDIVAFCRCKDVASELIEVFGDSNDIFRVRQRASFALERIADDGLRQIVKARTNFADLQDDMDELKGFYLRIMWPSALSVAEVVALLTPEKRPNYTGSYKMFLMDFAKTIPELELPLALNWLRTNRVDFDTLGPFGHFPCEVASRALHSVQIPAIRRSLLDLIADLGDQMHDFLDALREQEPVSLDGRRAFWQAVVSTETINLQRLLFSGALARAAFLVYEDLGFFIEQYKSAIAKVRERWKLVIFRVFKPDDSASLDQISELARAHEDIAKTLALNSACSIDPEDLSWQKDQYHRIQESETSKSAGQSAPSFAEAITEGLNQFERGDALGFCWVMELLDTEPEERHHQFGHLNVKVSNGKIWGTLTPAVQRRVLRDAVEYLKRQAVTPSEAWNEGKHYRTYQAAAPVFLLLFDAAMEALSELQAHEL